MLLWWKYLFVIMIKSLSLPLLLPAIDLLYGGIYCFVCQDYIYDKDMEQIAKEEQRKAWKLQGISSCILPVNVPQPFESQANRCLGAVMFVCLCVHRHRGEIHDVGADQKGARIITTQSKAEENHNKLYHRWGNRRRCQHSVSLLDSICLHAARLLYRWVCVYMCLWRRLT